MRSKISIYTACFQDPEVKVPEGGRRKCKGNEKECQSV